VSVEEGDIEFLTVDEVIELHEDQLANYGGSGGIRDLSLVQSAVAVPQASFGDGDGDGKARRQCAYFEASYDYLVCQSATVRSARSAARSRRPS
jgi:hypothetical protein